jgi:hypothetical protein
MTTQPQVDTADPPSTGGIDLSAGRRSAGAVHLHE